MVQERVGRNEKGVTAKAEAEGFYSFLVPLHSFLALP